VLGTEKILHNSSIGVGLLATTVDIPGTMRMLSGIESNNFTVRICILIYLWPGRAFGHNLPDGPGINW